MTTQAATPSPEEIIFQENNGLGCIHLNRPAALNALSEAMLADYFSALANWAERSDIKAVIVDAAGDRAFCAGGDIRALYDAQKQTSSQPPPGSVGRRFFESEYRLNHAIQTFPKPHICLIDGIVMGGGAGISINGSHRIIGENARFAMPEVKIGFVPDIGSSHFLNQIVGPAVGTWLVASGEIINASDLYALGIATHFVSSDQHNAFKAALIQDGGQHPKAVIADYASTPLQPSMLDLDAIREVFGAQALSTCVNLLKDKAQDDLVSDWAKARLEALSKGAPLSQTIAVELLRRSAGHDLKDCLMREFRCGQYLLAHHNFFEGVRCTLIDKGATPKWQPESLDAVSEGDTVAAFEAPVYGDLRFT